MVDCDIPAVGADAPTHHPDIGRERLLGIPEICEITGFAEVTAARIVRESGCGFKLHGRLFVCESSFFAYLHELGASQSCL